MGLDFFFYSFKNTYIFLVNLTFIAQPRLLLLFVCHIYRIWIFFSDVIFNFYNEHSEKISWSRRCSPGESYQSRKLKKERVYFYGNGLFIHNILAQLLILSLILITKRKPWLDASSLSLASFCNTQNRIWYPQKADSSRYHKISFPFLCGWWQLTTMHVLGNQTTKTIRFDYTATIMVMTKTFQWRTRYVTTPLQLW